MYFIFIGEAQRKNNQSELSYTYHGTFISSDVKQLEPNLTYFEKFHPIW